MSTRTEQPYKCPRCNYESVVKQNMKYHLNRKRVCPKVNDVELTPEIKESILINRIYHIPKQEKITNITNNNQTIQILNMSPDVKIEKLMSHLNKEIPNLQDSKYFRRMRNSLITHKERLNEDCRSMDDLFKEIMEFLEDSLQNDEFYNCFIASNIFHVYDDDEWQKRTIPKGMKHFIKIMKTMIFDAYEVCLIRQLSNWRIRQKAKDALKEYYSFICSFDNIPTFLEERNNDNKLLYNKNEPQYDNENYSSFVILDELQILWNNIERDMKCYKKNQNTNQLKQIIKNHSDETFKKLDEKVYSVQ